MLKGFFLFVVCLICTDASAKCLRIFQKNSPIDLALEALTSNSVKISNVTREGSEDRSLLFLIEDQVIGQVVLKYRGTISDEPYFESHVNLNTDYIGRGIGSAMYLVAASFVYKLNGVLTSTGSPAGKAWDVWANFRRKSIATRIFDPLHPRLEIFVFKKESFPTVDESPFDTFYD